MLLENFWDHVDASGDCWEWTAARSLGYGSLGVNGVTKWAHRVSWELLIGEIPEGMEIDHLCWNRACVNPDHMEVVTPHVNFFRGGSPSAVNARKQFCIRGHLLDEPNIYRRPDAPHKRQCRECIDIRSARRKVA